MSTKNIETLRKAFAVAESMIEAGYGLMTIYLCDEDDPSMHVNVPDGMPEPAKVEQTRTHGGYEHRTGAVAGVKVTWLVKAEEAEAAA